MKLSDDPTQALMIASEMAALLRQYSYSKAYQLSASVVADVLKRWDAETARRAAGEEA